MFSTTTTDSTDSFEPGLAEHEVFEAGAGAELPGAGGAAFAEQYAVIREIALPVSEGPGPAANLPAPLHPHGLTADDMFEKIRTESLAQGYNPRLPDPTLGATLDAVDDSDDQRESPQAPGESTGPATRGGPSAEQPAVELPEAAAVTDRSELPATADTAHGAVSQRIGFFGAVWAGIRALGRTTWRAGDNESTRHTRR